MKGPARTAACLALAGAAFVGVGAVAADDLQSRTAQWAEAAARQAEAAQRRERAARLRWDYELRRSSAHARMPDTLYASTPNPLAAGELSCPVLDDAADAHRVYRGLLDGGGRGAFTQTVWEASSASSGVGSFPASRATAPFRSDPSSTATKDAARGHPIQASGWTATAGPGSVAADSRTVHLFPSASEPLRQGFVRVINHSGEAGEATIAPVDDGGRKFDTLTLSLGANETVHFNSGDLENGNPAKGLAGATGPGQGRWRLGFASELDIEVLSYVRTADGFLTAMHDVAPTAGERAPGGDSSTRAATATRRASCGWSIRVRNQRR